MERICVNNCCLDDDQMKVVLDDSKNLLVVAGAGSGKTLTIVGKINFLIEKCLILPEKILCISFTNEAVLSLKNKLNNNMVDVMTFHKLGLSIIKNNNVDINISNSFLLEHIAHEFFLGIVLEDKMMMKKVLKYFGRSSIFNVEKKYSKFIKNNYEKILSFEELICKFIKLFKTNNFSLETFIQFKKSIINRKESLFLSIVLNVYLIYEKELFASCEIDFDDMLIKSKEIIDNGGSIKKYKYIIIDEYQDTSYVRYLLIKSILEKTQAKLIAVGDDFQSIYRFSGCDLEMFLNFTKYFSNSKILKIENSYRNSIELIDTVGDFIMKNPNQIKKNLKSNKRKVKPIKICYDYKLKELVEFIGGNILILGRNNNDIYKYIDKDFILEKDNLVYKKNLNIKLRYLSIHKSKGLEEDNVIILNVIDSNMGLPNKLKDDKILRFVSKSSDYLYDEERRIFYVALTRTRNNVYLMTIKKKESIFIKEILKSNICNTEIIKKR